MCTIQLFCFLFMFFQFCKIINSFVLRYLYFRSVLIFRAPTVCANSNTTRILIQLQYKVYGNTTVVKYRNYMETYITNYMETYITNYMQTRLHKVFKIVQIDLSSQSSVHIQIAFDFRQIFSLFYPFAPCLNEQEYRVVFRQHVHMFVFLL